MYRKLFWIFYPISAFSLVAGLFIGDAEHFSRLPNALFASCIDLAMAWLAVFVGIKFYRRTKNADREGDCT